MNDPLWDECVRFHGHACGGLVIGYRAARAAASRLGFDIGRTEDEDIVCVSETDACGVDCIQCLLSCTVGKGNMVLRPRGKTAFSFFDRRTGRGIRVVSKPMERPRTKEEAVELIMKASDEDLFMFKEPGFSLPQRAKIFGSRTCEICGETAREDMVRFQNGKIVCLDCFEPYGRGWM